MDTKRVIGSRWQNATMAAFDLVDEISREITAATDDRTRRTVNRIDDVARRHSSGSILYVPPLMKIILYSS